MFLKQCDPQTQASFHELEQFLPDGTRHKEFQKLAGQIRHNLTFHYHQSEKLIKKAISDRAARAEARTSSITAGDEAYSWHFKMADDVVDSVVVRQIWAIPKDTDLRAGADKVADWLYQIFLWFVGFTMEFTGRYFVR